MRLNNFRSSVFLLGILLSFASVLSAQPFKGIEPPPFPDQGGLHPYAPFMGGRHMPRPFAPCELPHPAGPVGMIRHDFPPQPHNFGMLPGILPPGQSFGMAKSMPALDFIRFLHIMDELKLTDRQVSSLRKILRRFRKGMKNINKREAEKRKKLEKILFGKKNRKAEMNLAKTMGNLAKSRTILLIRTVSDVKRAFKPDQWKKAVKMLGMGSKKHQHGKHSMDRRPGEMGSPDKHHMHNHFTPGQKPGHGMQRGFEHTHDGGCIHGRRYHHGAIQGQAAHQLPPQGEMHHRHDNGPNRNEAGPGIQGDSEGPCDCDH